MSSGATPPPHPRTHPQRYQVIVNRAVVLDAVDAISHADLRLDAILGYLAYGTEIAGEPFDAVINQDITAHAMMIAYPLDAPIQHGYVLRSHVAEVPS